MAAFPSDLIPSTRTYSPGAFPHTAHRVYDGSEARVRHSSTVLGVRLRLFFPAITTAELLTVIAHYNDQRGRFLPFAIPDDLLTGVTTPADFTPVGHQWRYAAKPTAQDISIVGGTNRHDLTIELETVPPENTIAQGARLQKSATLQAGSPQRGAFLDAVASLSAGGATGGQSLLLNAVATLSPGLVSNGVEFSDPLTATATLAAGAGTADTGNPNFSSVSLLLPLNGTNGSATFTDASSNAFSITGNGNAQISTAQSQWNGSSLLLDGSGDFLTTPTSSAFAITSDFTVEFWNYVLTTAGVDASARSLLHIHAGGNQGLHIAAIGTSLSVDDGLTQDFISSVGIVVTNAWGYHAVTKSGTTLRVFSGGTLLSTRTAQSYGTPDRCQVGRYSSGGVILDAHAHYNAIRITKGECLYTTSYTPPTGPFPTS